MCQDHGLEIGFDFEVVFNFNDHCNTQRLIIKCYINFLCFLSIDFIIKFNHEHFIDISQIRSDVCLYL